MRVTVQRRLHAMLSSAQRTEREIDSRVPLSPDWGRVLRNVRTAEREISEAVAFLRENLPE